MDGVVVASTTPAGIEQWYELLSQVGEGTYGKVFKARERSTGRLVALKKIRMETEKEGFPLTAAREIKYLKSLSHANIVQLERICASSATSVYLIFEYVDYDMAGLLHHLRGEQPHAPSAGPVRAPLLQTAQVKGLFKQLLAAISYLHARGIVHRDIKASNILVNRAGHLKLADFGLAKSFLHPDRDELAEEFAQPGGGVTRMMTNRVVTLWYRPPELLLGSTKYGPEVDMWGVGCILLELLRGRPPFAGQDEISQLAAITSVLGPLPEQVFESYPWFGLLQSGLHAAPGGDAKPVGAPVGFFEGGDLAEPLGADGLDLVRNLLQMDPTRRIRASDALEHPWLADAIPRRGGSDESADLSALLPPIVGDWHEFECKQQQRVPPEGAGGSSGVKDRSRQHHHLQKPLIDSS